MSNYEQVGINLGDPIYRGIQHGKQSHEDDLDDVLQRAVEAGCLKLMVTGSDLVESRNAIKIAQEHRKWILFQPCGKFLSCGWNHVFSVFGKGN